MLAAIAKALVFGFAGPQFAPRDDVLDVDRNFPLRVRLRLAVKQLVPILRFARLAILARQLRVGDLDLLFVVAAGDWDPNPSLRTRLQRVDRRAIREFIFTSRWRRGGVRRAGPQGETD